MQNGILKNAPGPSNLHFSWLRSIKAFSRVNLLCQTRVPDMIFVNLTDDAPRTNFHVYGWYMVHEAKTNLVVIQRD